MVKDLAEGMTKEELEKAIVFGGETSGFELGKSVRGLWGRGLKETIIALGEGEIETIKDGKRSKTKLWFDKKLKKPQYDDEALLSSETTTEPDGTKISINITNEKIRIPEYDKFKEQVSRHYALRDINSSEKRKISLTFDDLKRKLKTTIPIDFPYPKAVKFVKEKKSLPMFGDEVEITIYETAVHLDSPRNNPFGLAGILIKTNGSILDNQLFRFESDPAALYFYGQAKCVGLEERLRRGETEIIDPNRGGLEWRHEYCQALSQSIEEVLEPLVLEKRRVLEKKPEKEVKESTKKVIRKLCNLLNGLAKEELEELPEMPIEPEPDITNLLIKPEVANLPVGKPRVFSIYAPTLLISEEGQEAQIRSDNADIRPLSSTVKLEKHRKYPDQIWYRYFKVVGMNEGARGTITANLGKSIAFATVKVAPPKKRKGKEITGRKGGFISDIIPDELADPPQSGLEGVETAEGRLLLSELVGEAFCRELARQGMELGRYPRVPGGEVDSFNAAINEL